MNTTTTSSPLATSEYPDESARSGFPFLEQHSDLSAHQRWLRECHRHVQGEQKWWSDYRESDRYQHDLDALSQTTEIPVFDLIQSRQGQGHGGTWVHPQVAVDLARWISAPFAVWMDAWHLENVEVTITGWSRRHLRL